MTTKQHRRDFIKQTVCAGIGAGVLSQFPFSGMAAGTVATGKRIGIIGLDTSHSTSFTALLNDPATGDAFKGYKVVAAYPYGSRDIETSASRIPGYITTVQAKGVQIVNSIPELLGMVDVVMLETNDGRLHREQAVQVIKAGKQLFIDKPIANSMADAIAIFDLAKKNNVPIFSASSLRFTEGMEEVLSGKKIGKVLAADAYSPAKLEKTHIDFYWYGIHGVEMLFTAMGTGCKTVTRFYQNDMDLVVGVWEDGRMGTFRGTRCGKALYGGTIFGETGNATYGGYSYERILHKIIDFFETGISPVPAAATLEICAFIEAAQKSKLKGGKPIQMQEIFKQYHYKT
ncbi:Gfo/Idh/MocA family oxidoreductase [Pseudoflavitalea sp. X16]|uniref:Gfo/Idh/MocA family protein n=1 Tax=Paraflavitalea devenefica TaxID=2716334 RepID=UPI001421DFE2|nr:Gfo/Idh/MocA family oxidoreductase [Paraflavitalea devenefica]NII28472.1 Gfo/Idh/MocA family oxidoreductase [Paraflavitalea devenefica]